MNTKYIIALAGFLFGTGSLCVEAQSTRVYNGTPTAVPFLRISPDARASAMGEAGMALTPDANSVFWNLAKVPFSKSGSAIATTYIPWARQASNDMFLATLAGFHQFGKGQAVSASLRYFNMGEAELADYNGNLLQVTRPREFAADLGYARQLSDKLGLGIAMRYIHSNLGNVSANGNEFKAASAVAADVSFYYQGVNDLGQGWRLGAALTNLGSRIDYTASQTQKDFLPSNFGAGAGYTAVFNADNKLTLVFDLNKLLVPRAPADSTDAEKYRAHSVAESWVKAFDHSNFQLSAGAEYLFQEMFAIRAGYFTDIKNQVNRNYFTTGAGLFYHSFGLNFSYLVPFNDNLGRNPLSNTVRIGLTYDFSK